MKRYLIAGMIGLAAAGCAQTRTAANRPGGVGPVSLTSDLPSIHDSVNRGYKTAGADARTAKETADPQVSATGWKVPPSGARPAPFADQVARTPRPQASTTTPVVSAEETPSPGAPPVAQTTAERPPAPTAEPVAATPSSPPPSSPPGVVSDVVSGMVRPPALPSTPAPGQAAGDPLLGPNPDVMPKIDPSKLPAQASRGPAPSGAVDPSLAPTAAATPPGPPPAAVSGTPTPTETKPDAPADPLLGARPDVMPVLGRTSPGPAATGPAPKPSLPEGPAPASIAGPEPAPIPPPRSGPVPVVRGPGSEPLPPPAELPPPADAPAQTEPSAAEVPLGPDPDVMPKILLPRAPAGPSAKGAKPVTDTLPPPAEPAALPPAPSAALPPASSQPERAPAPSEPAVAMPPIELPKATDAKAPAAESAPATAPTPAPLPELEPLPPLPPPSPPENAEPPKEPAPTAARTIRDGNLVRVSADPTTIRSQVRPREVNHAGLIAAKVGDDVITIHDLSNAMRERLQGKVPQGHKLSRDDINQIANSVLDDMIDRNLILQEARKKLKDPKKMQLFLDMANKVFKENELPALLRKYSVASEDELKEKLAEKGSSLEAKREAFRDEFLSQGFMEQELGPRMRVDLYEMRDYYNAHLKDFDHPDQVTWREIVIEVAKFPNRIEARRAADDALARLRRGDDFAEVAKAISQGPNRASGGLWERMTPGSYLVASVNDVLSTLPLRQVSQVIEAPSSFHIVRVEERRPAGPARFDEVQDVVRTTLTRKKIERETTAYIEKLRRRTLITKNTEF